MLPSTRIKLSATSAHNKRGRFSFVSWGCATRSKVKESSTLVEIDNAGIYVLTSRKRDLQPFVLPLGVAIDARQTRTPGPGRVDEEDYAALRKSMSFCKINWETSSFGLRNEHRYGT